MTQIRLRIKHSNDEILVIDFFPLGVVIHLSEEWMRRHLFQLPAGCDIKSVNISISTEANSTVVISNLEFFSITSFKGNIARIGHLKIYDIKKHCNVFRIECRRIDIENSSVVFNETTFKSLYINMEKRSRLSEIPDLIYNGSHSISIRESEGRAIKPMGEINTLSIEGSVIREIAKQFEGNCLSNIKISRGSEIQFLFINMNLQNLEVSDSSINHFFIGANGFANSLTVNRTFISNIEGLKQDFTANFKNTDYRDFLSPFERKGVKKPYLTFLENNYDFTFKQKKFGIVQLFILKYIFGYGFRPGRILLSSIIIMFLFSYIYFQLSLSGYDFFNVKQCFNKYELFTRSTFFSVSIYTLLGFSEYIPTSNLSRLIVGIEALIGLIFNSLFITSFYRRFLD